MKRFMWIAAAVLLSIGVGQATAADEDGFKSIFDGKDMKLWDGNPDFWRAEDGTITGQTTAEKPTKGNTFCIWRGGDLDDFELKCEYKIIGGNSGIQYRSFEVPQEKWVVGGYQADFEAGKTYSGILYGERDRGILALRGQKTEIGADHKPKVVGEVGKSDEIQAKINNEDWNSYHVIAAGNHFIHKINGITTVDVTDNDVKGRRMTGIMALQLHAGPPMKVQFRNIMLKRTPLTDGRKKLIFIAGGPSHAYMQHAFRAGTNLLKKALDENYPGVTSIIYTNGWPKDPTAFDNVDAICIYSDGGGGHPANPHIKELDALMKKGVGLGLMHYAVETVAGEPGNAFLDWTGGFFEMNWSVNPTWTLVKPVLAKDHAITRGVKPFINNDEWYYHMRFRENMEGVVPILSDVPPKETLNRPDGTHSGNPTVRKEAGQPQVLMWATQRADGGRGFGYTGGHYHRNWGTDDNRKLILNALVWISRAEVPENGVESKRPDIDQMRKNQDFAEPKDAKFFDNLLRDIEKSNQVAGQ